MTREEGIVWLYAMAGRYAAMIAPTFQENGWKWLEYPVTTKNVRYVPAEQEIREKLLSMISDIPERGNAQVMSGGLEVMCWSRSGYHDEYLAQFSMPHIELKSPTTRKRYPYIRSDGLVL